MQTSRNTDTHISATLGLTIPSEDLSKWGQSPQPRRERVAVPALVVWVMETARREQGAEDLVWLILAACGAVVLGGSLIL